MAIVDELIAILGFDLRGEDAAQRYQQTLDGLEERMSGIADAAGQFAATVATGASAAFAALGKSVIDTSAEFGSYQATLETIEGSADKARQSLDWISDFGKTTPYDVRQVTEAFVALKAYGIDPIADDALRTLGDTASAMGKPLMQAVEALADAATGEFERLKEFGIRAQVEGKNVTFAWTENGEQLTETVKKNSTAIRGFLLDTMGGRFSGAMVRQSSTWGGLMSNLGDTWTDFQRRIGGAGFFETVRDQLAGLLAYLGRLDEDGTLDRWAERLSIAYTTAAEAAETFARRTAENVAFLAENWEALRPHVMKVAGALAWLMARAFPVITAFTALGFAVDDLLAYLQGGESFIGDFIGWIRELTGVSADAAEAMAGIGGALIAGLASVVLFKPGKVIGYLGRVLFRAIIALAPLLLKAVGALALLISNPVGWVVALAGMGAVLAYVFWDEIEAGWDWLSDKVPDLLKQFGDWLVRAPVNFARAVTRIVRDFWRAMRAGWARGRARIGDIIRSFGQWLADGAWSLAGAAAKAVIGFWSDLRASWATGREKAATLVSDFTGWLVDSTWNLASAAASAFKSFWDGIGAKWPEGRDRAIALAGDFAWWLARAPWNLAKAAAAAVTGFWEKLTPEWAKGEATVAGLASDLAGWFEAQGWTIDGAKDAASGFWADLKTGWAKGEEVVSGLARDLSSWFDKQGWKITGATAVAAGFYADLKTEWAKGETTVSGLADDFAKWLDEADWSGPGEVAGSVAGTFISNMESAWGAQKAIVTGLATTLQGWFAEADWSVSGGLAAASSFWGDLSTGWAGGEMTVAGLAVSVGTWFAAADWSKIGDAADEARKGFMDGLEKHWPSGKEKVEALATTVGGWFDGLTWEGAAGSADTLVAAFLAKLKTAFDGIRQDVIDLFGKIGDWVAEVDWKQVGIDAMDAMLEGMESLGGEIRGFVKSLVPDFVLRFMGEEDGAAGGSYLNAEPVEGAYGPPPPPGSSTALADNALAVERRFAANLERLNAAATGSGTTNDWRVDRRQYRGGDTNVTLNQTVRTATDAPDAAARATGDALARAAGGLKGDRVNLVAPDVH